MLFLVPLCHSRESRNLFFLSFTPGFPLSWEWQREGEIYFTFFLLYTNLAPAFYSLHEIKIRILNSVFFFPNSTLYAIKAYAIRPSFLLFSFLHYILNTIYYILITILITLYASFNLYCNKAANNFAAVFTYFNLDYSLVNSLKLFSYKVFFLKNIFRYLKILLVFGAKGGTRTRMELPTGS